MMRPRSIAVALLLTLPLAARTAALTAQAPELVLMKGHASTISRMTFNRTGQFLLTSSSDAPGIVWRVADALPGRFIPSADVTTVFSDKDSWLWASDAASIRHLDPGSTAGQLQERNEEAAVEICRWSTSPTGQWELQVSCDGEHRTFVSTDGTQNKSQSWPPMEKFSASSGYWAGNLFVVVADNRLLTFDPQQRRVSASTRLDSPALLNGIAGPPGARLILVDEQFAGPSRRLQAYDALTHARRAEYKLDPIQRVAIDPTGTYILRLDIHEGDRSATFSIRRTLDGKPVADGTIAAVDLLDSVAMSPDGRTFAIALLGGDLKFVDAETKAITSPRVLHPIGVTGLALSEHHESLVSTGFGSVQSWDLDRGYPTALVTNATEGTIAVSQNGGVAFGKDGKIHLAVGEHHVAVNAKSARDPQGLALSNDGKYGAWLEDAGTSKADLRLSDGTILCRDTYGSHPVFSPDSKLLAFDCPANILRIYDLESHQVLPGRAPFTRNASVAFDSESKGLVTADGSKVCVRNPRTLKSGPCFDADGPVTSLAYLHDDDLEMIATATSQNYVDVTVLVTKDEPKEPVPVRMAHLPLLASSARQLLLTGTGELITAGDDGAVRFWSIDSNDARLLATMMASGVGDLASFVRAQTGARDWVVVSPEGFFDAGGQGIDWMQWRSGDTIYPGDLLFSDFYTPGLLGMILRNHAPRPNPRTDLTTFLKTPGLRALVAQRSARLIRGDRDTTLCLADPPANFGLYVDGTVEVVPYFEHDVTGPPDCQYRHTWPTAVQLEALNTYGLTQPVNRPTRWDQLKVPLKSGAKLHVVTVAGSQYDLQKTGFAPLPGAAENVKAIRNFFLDQQKQSTMAFPKIEVWDPVPLRTRQETLRSLEKIFRNVSADDILFLYLSGHGKSPWGQTLFFLVPETGRGDSLDDLRTTAISSVDLAEYLRIADAKRILLVVDTCQSAASFETLSRFGEAVIQIEEFYALEAMRLRVGNPRDGMGFYLLASASPLQTAQLQASEPSRLVQQLLRAWKDKAGQHAMTARGLMEAFRPDLVNWPGEQRPVTTALGMDFDLPSAQWAPQIRKDSNIAAAVLEVRKRADALYLDGHLKDAISAYRKVLAIDPNDSTAYNQIGNAQSKLGQTDEAERSYRKAVEANGDAVAYYNLGRVLNKREHYAEAERMQRQAIALDANYPLAHYGLGNALSHQKKYAEAASAYRRSLELDDDEDVRFLLANVLDRMGRDYDDQGEPQKADRAYEEAQREYRAVIKANPEHSGAYGNLIGVISSLDRYNEVEPIVKAMIENDIETASSYSNLSNAYNNMGRYQEAEAAASKAIQLNPTSAIAYGNLGAVLNNRGKYGDAETRLRKAIALNSSSSVLYESLGTTLYNVKRYSEAEQAYRKAVELNTTNGFPQIDLANVLARQSKEDEAQAVYSKAIASIAAPNGVATSSDREALVADGSAAPRYDRYGTALADAKRYKDAANAFGRAVALDPANPHYHHHLADALRKFGRIRQADEEDRRAASTTLK